MRVVTFFAILMGLSYTVDQVYDTCNRMQSYGRPRKDLAYTPIYSTQVDDLSICPRGQSCCTKEVENYFYQEVETTFKRRSFLKSYDIKILSDGHSRIGEYMTEVLTLARSHNSRTRNLVSVYINASDAELVKIDSLQYPIQVLLDIAQSYGVVELTEDNTDCIAEMKDNLRELGMLQIDGLYLARLLYRAVPKGIDVMKQLEYQELPIKCIKQLVKAHRCSLCLDGFYEKPCMTYCLDIAQMCFKHFKDVSTTWEIFASMTERVLDSLDTFTKVYQDKLERTIRDIRKKLSDSDIADMCGFDIASNLARHKRQAQPTSNTRTALFDGTFMVGMLAKLDEAHCIRTSTKSNRCWNGSSIGPYVSDGTMSIKDGYIKITPELQEKINNLDTFNVEFAGVEDVQIEAIRSNLSDYETATEVPNFVDDSGSSKTQVVLSLTILSIIISLLTSD